MVFENEVMGGTAVVAGLIIGILGSLLIWLLSLTVYAFGQLVDYSDEQTALLKEIVSKDCNNGQAASTQTEGFNARKLLTCHGFSF